MQGESAVLLLACLFFFFFSSFGQWVCDFRDPCVDEAGRPGRSDRSCHADYVHRMSVDITEGNLTRAARDLARMTL